MFIQSNLLTKEKHDGQIYAFLNSMLQFYKKKAFEGEKYGSNGKRNTI